MGVSAITQSSYPVRKITFKAHPIDFAKLTTDEKLNNLNNSLELLKEKNNQIYKQNTLILNALKIFASIESNKARGKHEYSLACLADRINNIIK